MSDRTQQARERAEEARDVLERHPGATSFVIHGRPGGGQTLKPIVEDALFLVDRVAALETALHEIHEHQCGCDQPGHIDFCVAQPAESFAALAGAATEPETPDA